MADLLDLDARALLDTLARRGRGPAAGSAAAIAAAVAAALAAKAARTSTEGWRGAAAAAAQAESLRSRLAPLAQADADAYEAAVAQLDGSPEADPERRDFQIGRALTAAADVPLRIAESAADVALLAAEIAERGNTALRPEAAGAAALAEAAARIAAHLVEVNLATRPDDERLGAARRAATTAAEAASRALSPA